MDKCFSLAARPLQHELTRFNDKSYFTPTEKCLPMSFFCQIEEIEYD